MLNPGPPTIYLKDYTPPGFLVSNVDLDIDLREDHAVVTASLKVQRNPKAADPQAPLELYGDELELVSVALDGVALAPARYRADASGLSIHDVPARFELTTVCRLQPKRNTKLMGLYASQDGYFTQCEAEGFRRITYFLDRPDVMSRYTTTIRADRGRYPVLLVKRQSVASADEPVRRARGTGSSGSIRFPKPAYLFAMVAAKLDKLEDTLRHALRAQGQAADLRRAGQARPSGLRHAGAQDARCAGTSRCSASKLDLDQYMIVAVGDFNMGAMENKGLNIFNTKYVLARPDTATDTDYHESSTAWSRTNTFTTGPAIA